MADPRDANLLGDERFNVLGVIYQFHGDFSATEELVEESLMPGEGYEAGIRFYNNKFSSHSDQ